MNDHGKRAIDTIMEMIIALFVILLVVWVVFELLVEFGVMPA
jgi:hypothetical protein